MLRKDKQKHLDHICGALESASATGNVRKLYGAVRLPTGLAVWCSGNALVSINAVALHRARLVLGWVTAFGQVNCLIT